MSLLYNPNKTLLILIERKIIYYEPTIIRSNYYRCTRADPVPADIPLVEYHSSGGGGDGQQVKFFFVFYSKSQNILKYFSKKYFHTLERAQNFI